MDGLFLQASICLDDVTDNDVFEASNGKRYLNFTIAERRNVGKYGETHSLYTSHRTGGSSDWTKTYIGSAQPPKKRD